MEKAKKWSVLELFSGIGGMSVALNASAIQYKIVGTYEINPIAFSIYKHNFKHKEVRMVERNINSLSEKILSNLKPDILVMSPPCQPFTRQGLKNDILDKRCEPLLHILDVLNGSEHVPEIILVENVFGFEMSEARAELIQTLRKRNFDFQEFLLNPREFGIPNSRLRYYMIAKQKLIPFCFDLTSEPMAEFPICVCLKEANFNERNCHLCSKKVLKSVSTVVWNKFSKWANSSLKIPCRLTDLHLKLKDFCKNMNIPNEYQVKSKDVSKYYQVFDIVTPNSKSCCCFTKGYGNYFQGTGSILYDSFEPNLSWSASNDSRMEAEVTDVKCRDILEISNCSESDAHSSHCSDVQSFSSKSDSRSCSCSDVHCCKGSITKISNFKNEESSTNFENDIQKQSNTILNTETIQNSHKIENTLIKNLSNTIIKDKLRFFSPEEILSLMCFPDDFKISSGVTNRQAYKVLGNSINVFIVSLLIALMTE